MEIGPRAAFRGPSPSNFDGAGGRRSGVASPDDDASPALPARANGEDRLFLAAAAEESCLR